MKLTTQGLYRHHLDRLLACALTALTGLAFASQAEASVIETLYTTSSYTYDFVPGLPGMNSGAGSTNAFQISGAMPGQATDIQANYTSLAATDASFFFLHNIQCKGYCSIGVFTTLTNTVTNTGTKTVNVRLDSSITAGHLGLVQNASTPSTGIFDFDIFETRGGIDYQIYDATGKISSAGASIVTSDGSVFNGLEGYQDPAQIGLDWDETELTALLRPLAPGETTVVTYQLSTTLSAFGLCLDVTRCDGVQVAFGDPRNRGGVMGRVALDALNSSLAPQPVGYVLDRGFDMARLKVSVVAVPEPSSWAMMIIGFGLMGAPLRRREPRRQVLG